jgi:hypothetical protein
MAKRRKNPGSSETTTLLILGGVAVGGYLLYENFFATPAVAAAPAGSPTGTTPAAPVTTSPSAPAGNPTVNAIGEPINYTTPGGGSALTPTTLAGLWNDIQAWAATDSNFTSVGGVLQGTPDHWSFYISYIWPNAPTGWAGAWPPDTNAMVSAALPGVDFTQPMTGARWWAVVMPGLQGGGLSGLACGCDGGGEVWFWLLGAVTATALLAYFGSRQ